MKGLAFSILCFASAVVFADDFKTVDGKEYKNATVSRVEPDGIVLTSKSGISKIYFTELPKEVQERFHYDAAKATAYSAEQNAALEQLRKQREEAQREKAEETAKNNKYFIKQASRQAAAARQTAVAPTPTTTPVRAAESRELASIRAEAEVREAEMRGDHFGAEVARIKAYYAAAQAGDPKLANELHELEEREFNQAVGRRILQGK